MSESDHIWCITKNYTNPAYHGARNGVTRVGQRLGFRVTNVAPSAPDDVAEQETLLRRALDARPEAILIAPAHPSALGDALCEVVSAGITLVYFVSEDHSVQPTTFVTADNYQLANATARYLLGTLTQPTDITIMAGSANSETSRPRSEGFAAAARAVGATITTELIGNYQRDDAYQAMSEHLDKHGTTQAVLAANDYMAMGVIDALHDHGTDAAVTGINAMPEAIGAIKAGTLAATAAYDAMKMASIACEAAIRGVRGESVARRIELPAEVVHRGNCAEWDLPYEERPLPVWEQVVG